MKPDAGSLEEVIVTGYGNFKKSSFTGAAANVDPGKLSDVPVASVQDKIAGSVPGVTVTSASGAPGSVSNIRIVVWVQLTLVMNLCMLLMVRL